MLLLVVGSPTHFYSRDVSELQQVISNFDCERWLLAHTDVGCDIASAASALQTSTPGGKRGTHPQYFTWSICSEKSPQYLTAVLIYVVKLNRNGLTMHHAETSGGQATYPDHLGDLTGNTNIPQCYWRVDTTGNIRIHLWVEQGRRAGRPTR